VLFKNGNLLLKIIYELNNNQIPVLNNNFVWRPCVGRLWDESPGLPLEIPLVGGIAPMLLGGIGANARGYTYGGAL